jgi:copper transport protein
VTRTPTTPTAVTARRAGRLRRLVVAVLAAVASLGLLVGGAGPAHAHAALRATTPGDGATAAQAPEVVTLEFNEPVTTTTGALRVFDETGARVDDATVLQPDERTVGVGLDRALGDGSYVVTWRATSADGHPIRGAFVFSVGTGDGVDEALLERLFAGDADAVTGVLAAGARSVAYLGTLLAAGLVLLTALVPLREDERSRLAAWTRRGVAAALVASLLALPLQTVLATGFGPLQALRPTVLAEVAAGSVGLSVGVRVVALVVLWWAASTTVPVALGAGALATWSFLLDGHTRTVEPTWLLVAGDAVHLAAAAAWLGVVVGLAAVLRARRLDDDPVAAATVVSRASGIATVAIVALTVAGFAMSWALVREPRALTTTAYGWTLLAKVGLAAAVVAIGAYNRQVLVPAVRRATASTDTPARAAGEDRGIARAGWRRLGGTVRAESALLVVVLVVTGVLVNLRPAAEAAGITGAYETTVDVDEDLRLNLVVDPNVAGANEVHLYVLDRTGRPARDLDGVRMRLTLPERDIGPIEREPFPAGPGHWVLSGRELSIAGRWAIDVVVEIDRFTERTVTVDVVVNPA